MFATHSNVTGSSQHLVLFIAYVGIVSYLQRRRNICQVETFFVDVSAVRTDGREDNLCCWGNHLQLYNAVQTFRGGEMSGHKVPMRTEIMEHSSKPDNLQVCAGDGISSSEVKEAIYVNTINTSLDTHKSSE